MAKKAIEIKNLNFTYPDGTQALKDVSLDILEGEAVGIIGPNGAGKSTLLLHFNGILSGNNHIRIFDIPISDKTLPQIRRKVGLIFQDPNNQLFMPTVFDDVAFGPLTMGLSKDKVQTAVDEALGEVDLLNCRRRSSHHLSSGQKKRVALATVLSMNPEILVLDEPSSDLDPKHRRDLIVILKRLTATKIIATHDLDLVLEVCSRVVIIDEGKVVAIGDAREVFNNKQLLESHNLGVPSALCRIG
ncbi:MAG: cobalt ABC transporter ATP-binding protein [Omnitrophica WOR_2 bacterium GWF2_43_52]|nr:MAG: cobalt ABC transporter ATP-binding protein [Omnitrophica WOR_2 bacterium GWA2_44_7]OGX14270.1 MAG: cobalt ABC transporter ATP-binding protein [Omnitrophica WOR_2 bacterium GWC2_44_8]OGX22143.1 MAG: cobalt ABC transporter ATP-binding protein [Omnitrophica WOR_2 bacterium GWF2_43_52]OGX54250.1 MAG: cobalt ABC transporter ATP-binding protein [Omnitrophica WOR_2 bacterium RIFOXYC2_FULL_43_9]HAH20615.1 cobalt ABC transporter ATP-binding protein [Candidatus Omnitrophota bacterium]